jgi:serine/threonine protein kinase
VIIGDYKIERELARSRTACLFEAVHAQLGRRVTIKLMAAGPQIRGARATFVREAEVLDRVRHASIARVYDCGVLADGRAWFAVDRANGPTLAQVIASGARIDPLRIILDLAAVLEHAHAHGYAHRNLRADAIICGSDPRGPALRVDDWSHVRELALSPSDAAADVHALGVIAFQVLSGVMAFGSGSAALQPGASAATRFPRASRLLTALIDRMLARDVRSRPSVGEVREAAGALVIGQLRRDDSARDDLDLGEHTRIQQMPQPNARERRAAAYAP